MIHHLRKKFSVSSDASTGNETLKDKTTDIISILEDSSSNATESLNEIYLDDKSSCTDLSIVKYIFQNRTNNEKNKFDDSSTKSLKDNTKKENLVDINSLSNSKSTKKLSFSLLLFLFNY